MGYSDGSYFSKNGSACKCHGRGTCGEASDCNCIVVSGTSQCYGWSMWVENKLFGYNEISKSSNFTTVVTNYSNCTGSGIYNKLNGKIGAGTHIRTLSSKKGYPHSVSVISYDQNGIDITDCNHSGKCQVDVRHYTWDSFANFMNGYGGISFVKACKNGNPSGNNYYNSYGFDNPSNNETITEGTFLFQGWIDAKKEIASITCSINHGARYVETALYKRPDVPNATAFRVEIDSNLLNIGKNDVALCVNFKDGSATVVENRTVTWSPKLLWGFDLPTEGTQISDNQFQFSGWIETGRRLERITCSINHGEQYLTANLYKRPDVPNATAFRLDIASSNLHYGENYIAVCAHYADGTGETIAEHKVKKCTIDAMEYPQNGEKFTCKNAWFLLQGWSTDDNKVIDHFEFTIDGTRYTTAAHNREDLSGNARYYREQVPLNRLKNGKNQIEIFAYYTNGNSRSIGRLEVLGDVEHKWNAGEVTQNATCKETGVKTYTCTNCQTSKTEEIPLTGKHENTEIRNVKEATCTKEGYSGDTYCKDCGTLISTGSKINKKAHVWGSGKVTQEPTCTMPGIKTYTCAECLGTKTEEIPATGKHENKEIRNAKEATCAEEGYTGDIYCKDCGTKVSTGQKLDKKEHTWDSGVVTIPPTCVERGEKTYTCIVCHATKIQIGKEGANKNLHTWDTGTVTETATCTKAGVKTYVCTLCGETKIENIPATGKHQNTEKKNAKEATCAEEGYTGDLYCQDCGTKLRNGEKIEKKPHTWDDGSITTTATCTERGIKTYTCTVCNTTKTAEIPSTGHQHTQLRNAKEATCAEAGYTGDTYCTDCGTKLSSGKAIPKTDHIWDAGKVTKNATCIAKGIKTFTCTVCEATRTEEIPVTGHKNKITKFAKKASCKSDGYTGDIYCQDCGVLLEEGNVIPKSEHTWNAGEVTKPATCTEIGTKTYTCIECGTTQTEKISSTGHGATEVRNKKEATCAESGYTGDTYCTICNQKISSGNVVSKTDHVWNSGSITKQPTTAEEGIKTYTCRNCGLTRNETIAKLKPQKATPGKSVKNPSSNGVYKVLKDGQSVEFTKPLSKRATIKVPDTIKVDGITCKVTGIAANTFKNNTSLKNVTIGKNVTTVGTNAFYGCKNLTKVSGGNSIVKFGDRSFANCGNLGSITIPGSVRSIGKQAFYNCKKLRSVTIKTSALSGKTIGSKAFAGTYKKPTVKVPAKQMKAYKKLLKARGMSSKAVYRK